jgi:antibiotic biosynthesis monooxygenase (ABM) superfamily enzyme
MTNTSYEYRECDDQEGPVTVTVRRRVKPGREAEYEAWLKHISGVAGRFTGHMGVNVIRPDGVRHKDYVTIVRFDTYRHLRDWEESPERAELTVQLEGLVEGEARVQRVTGLEFWFTLPEAPAARPPSPHKMALVLVVVFGLVVSIHLAFGTWLAQLPGLVRIAVVVVAQVLLVTYLIMPQVTRLLRPWLFADDAARGG